MRCSYWMSDGKIVAWYAGAERIYGYKSGEVFGQHVALLYPDEDALRAKLDEELKRAVSRRAFRKRRLAGEKGRVAILG